MIVYFTEESAPNWSNEYADYLTPEKEYYAEKIPNYNNLYDIIDDHNRQITIHLLDHRNLNFGEWLIKD